MAAVFLWFGIDKIIHPSYWINAWTAQHVGGFLAALRLPISQLVYLGAIFEILVGLSLLTGVFIRFFSLLAIMFLIGMIFWSGWNDAAIRDLGLLGGFLAIFLWPNARGRL